MLKRAYSLIELLTVMAIIALISSISYPIYRDYKIRSQVMKAVTVQNDIADEIIHAYNSGAWDCNTVTTFSYGGYNYTVNNGGGQPASGYTDALSGVIIGTAYGPYVCGNKWFATIQVFLNNMPAGTEVVCLLGRDGQGVVQKVCGVYNGEFVWQPEAKYLPPGWDCIFTSNTRASGGTCSDLL